MKSDPRGEWCIHYCKKTDQTNWNLMKLQRSDGVLVSAKNYNEVFKFFKYKDAWEFAKKLLTSTDDSKYDVSIKKISKPQEEELYFSVD